jgi:hypothetical protein
LWTASAVSNLGDGATLVAGPLLAATLTRDPRLVAGLADAQRLPWLLFSLVSGALVDRLDRRLLMVRVDAVRCAAVGLLGVAVLADAATLPLLYGVFFALGTAETLFDNAAVSIVPAVVPKDRLATANGRLLGVQMVANELVAPPLGGLLFATAAAVPFLLDAGSFAAAAALVAAMGGRFRVERPRGRRPDHPARRDRRGGALAGRAPAAAHPGRGHRADEPDPVGHPVHLGPLRPGAPRPWLGRLRPAAVVAGRRRHQRQPGRRAGVGWLGPATTWPVLSTRAIAQARAHAG